MSLPNENGSGNDGYSNGNGFNNNTPQNFQNGTVENLHRTSEYPLYPNNVRAGGNNAFQNPNAVYEGHYYQNVYGYGPNNNVGQYLDPINYEYALQQSIHFHQEQSTMPGHSTFVENETNPSIFVRNQNSDNDSPPNFRIPSTETQNTNESDTIEGLELLDISSNYRQHQSTDEFIGIPFSPLEFTNEDIDEILKSWSPNNSIQMPLENQDENDEIQNYINPAIVPLNGISDPSQNVLPPSAANNMPSCPPQYHQTQPTIAQPFPYEQEPPKENVQTTLATKIRSSSSPSSSSSSEATKNPVGRPPEYETDEQRKEAHKKASKKSYKKRREEKAEYRKKTETTVAKTEAENANLRTQLNALRNQFTNLFNTNYNHLSEEERAYAQQIYHQ